MTQLPLSIDILYVFIDERKQFHTKYSRNLPINMIFYFLEQMHFSGVDLKKGFLHFGWDGKQLRLVVKDARFFLVVRPNNDVYVVFQDVVYGRLIDHLHVGKLFFERGGHVGNACFLCIMRIQFFLHFPIKTVPNDRTIYP